VLSPPPAKLGNFPRRALRSTTDLVRIQPNDLGPWWFSSGGHGRFDLAPPNGTCYVALSPLGAFVEVFRGFTIVDSADVAHRALSRLCVPRDVVLADCTSPRARRFGVTGEIHSTADYTATQGWAEAFRGAGFAGVRYFCGQDPSQRELGVALFGVAGAADWPVAETTPIAEQVLRAVERRFGIHVLPTP
jgi:hypothetical protein